MGKKKTTVVMSVTYKKWRTMATRKGAENGKYVFSVCEEWQDYDNFLLDMGKVPDGMWLRRKDPTQPYGPSNCFWGEPAKSVNEVKP